MVLFIITIFVMTPIGIFLKSDSVKSFIIMQGSIFLLYSLLLFFEWIQFSVLQQREVTYEPLFLLRKHPGVYQSVKMMTELHFIEKRRLRFLLIKTRGVILFFFYSLILLLIFANSIDLGDSFILWFMFSHFLMVLDDYIESIFDFDKPEGKRKHAKMGVTKLVQKILEDLSRITNPLPRPI